MERKPDYNRLLKTLRHEEPDWVPLAELEVDRPIQAAFLGRPVETIADEVDFWHRAGYDYMYQRPNYEYQGAPPVVAVGTRLHFTADVLGGPASFDLMHAKGQIAGMAGLDRYPWPEPDTIDYAPLDELATLLPEGMGIISGVGGIFTRMWMLLGFERMSLAIHDDPDLVAALFQRIGQIQCEVLRRVVKKDRVFAIWYGDDLGYTEGLMVSPKTLRKHLFCWIEEMASIAHGAGMPLIMHSDGKLTDILDDLVALGLDAIHPIEPKAMDIRQLKRQYRDKLALFGNVDLNVLGLGTPQQTREMIRELIRDLAPGGGYALSSSNSISNYVKIENYRAMLDAAREFGQYPVQLAKDP
jgi:uroporphyrinogen decarboxylase